jgi:hypothetical protein
LVSRFATTPLEVIDRQGAKVTLLSDQRKFYEREASAVKLYEGNAHDKENRIVENSNEPRNVATKDLTTEIEVEHDSGLPRRSARTAKLVSRMNLYLEERRVGNEYGND